MSRSKKDALLNISKHSLYAAGVMPVAIRYCFRIFRRHFRPGNVLELGPAEGVMTELIASVGMPTTVVEGSALFSEDLKRRFPQIRVFHALFEEFSPEEEFDNIIMGHVLEHVKNPVRVLAKVRKWLKPNGLVFCAVPNARSLHRQAAVIMGLLPSEDALNDLDRHHGHERVFTPESLRSTFIEAGFHIELFGGYYLKPISNGQIETHWTLEMVEAFMRMGERYPDVAGEIYVVASLQAKADAHRIVDAAPRNRGRVRRAAHDHR